MQKIKKFLVPTLTYIFVFLLLVVPALSFGAEGKPDLGKVSCDNSAGNPCDFKALMREINTVIQFLLFDMVVPIAALMFFYAGFQLVTAGEETAGARTKAKSIFSNAVYGLIISVSAWLVIRTLLSILGFDGDWIGFPKI